MDGGVVKSLGGGEQGLVCTSAAGKGKERGVSDRRKETLTAATWTWKACSVSGVRYSIMVLPVVTTALFPCQHHRLRNTLQHSLIHFVRCKVPIAMSNTSVYRTNMASSFSGL